MHAQKSLENRKKIIYIITKSNWGGAQRYVYDLAVNLPKSRFEVKVAGGGFGQLSQKLTLAGIPVIEIPMLERDVNFFKDIRACAALVNLFLREKPDVIHLSSSKAGGIGAVAGRIAGLILQKQPRVLFTVHGWGFHEDRSPLARAAIFFLSWLSTRLHNTIILIDAADYRSALKFIPAEKLALVNHGISPPKFFSRSEARALLEKKIGARLGESVALIGTIAELTKNKGLIYLIDAAARLGTDKDFCMVIIGGGEDRETLARRIRANGLEKKIFLVGFLPDAARYLKGLDLFVLPSLKEGLPYVLLEAMRARLDIVASRVGGIPDLLLDEKTGLVVEPKNAAALAAALERLLNNKALAARMGRAGYERIKSFSIEAMVRATSALYNLL